MAALLMTACRSNVDLTNIDTTSQVSTCLAMPICTMTASIADLIGEAGNNVKSLSWEEMDGKKVLVFRDSLHMDAMYVPFESEEHIGEADEQQDILGSNLDLYNLVQTYRTLHPGEPVVLTGQMLSAAGLNPLELHTEMMIHVDNLNTGGNVRLDSMIIETADLDLTLALDGMSMSWESIRQLKLDLGDQFSVTGSREFVLYDNHMPGDYGFGKKIENQLKDFVICLLKDKTLQPTSLAECEANVIDSAKVYIVTTIEMDDEDELQIDAEFPKVSYEMTMEIVKFKAAWGFFKGDLQNWTKQGVFDLSQWDLWQHLQKESVLPLHQPMISMELNTNAAGSFVVDVDELYSESANGERRYATFDGEKEYHRMLHEDERISLDPSTIGQYCVMRDTLDSSDKKGNIDHLFGLLPEKIGYNIGIHMDPTSYVARIVGDSTIVHGNIMMEAPFILDKGTRLGVNAEIADMDLSSLSLDSLVENQEWLIAVDSARIKMWLDWTNDMPFAVRAAITLYNEYGEEVCMPDGTPVKILGQDTIVVNPGLTPIFHDLGREEYEAFCTTRHMDLNIVIDDACTEGQQYPLMVTDQDKVKVAIGVAASVDAKLELDKL